MAGVLAIAAFFCGAFAVIAQSYLAREFLVAFLGNEMSLAVLLFGWLAGVAAGARAGRARCLERVRPAFLFVCGLLAWVVLFPAALMTVRMSRAILGIAPGMLAPFWKLLLVSLLFVGPFSAFVGFMFVTVCRLWEDFSKGATPVGYVYIAEAAGGVAGGAFFTFCLAGRAGPFTFGFAAQAALALLVVLFAYATLRARLFPARTAATVIVGTLFLTAVGTTLWLSGRGARLDEHSHIARMASVARGVVIEWGESRYQNVTAVLLEGQYTIFGNGEAITTFPEPLLDELEGFLVLSEHPAGREVLVVGGGIEFPAALLSCGAESVDYVEIDPMVVEVSRTLAGAGTAEAVRSGRLRVHHRDARRFVGEAAAGEPRWDYISVRVGEPSSLMLNRLYTREFMAQARACLREGGVFAVPVTLAGSYLGGDVGRYAGDIYRTMGAVFAEIVATPEVDSIFIASPVRGVVTSSIEELTRRFETRGLHSSLYPAAFGLAFPQPRTDGLDEELRALAGRINTDWHPTTYSANLALWARFSESPLARLLAGLAAAPRWALFAAFCAAAALGALPVFLRRRPASAAVIAVLYTGWAAMSMTVLLLYAFQVACGYVYEWIGVLVGFFMAGTAGGAVMGTWAKGRRAALIAAEVAVLGAPLAVLAALAVMKTLLPAGAATWVILALCGVAGTVTGFEFPVAAGVLHAGGFAARAAGSRLEAADHAGACAGAILAGVVLVPALGIIGSLVLVAAVKVISAACALRCRRA